MKEEQIRRLVKIVEDSNIGELEITRWGRTIRISKNLLSGSGANHAAPNYQVPASMPQPPQAEELTTKADEQSTKSKTGIEIKSPMVGTFYSAPAPDADPYVDVNKSVKKGQVLCIIEAMKLMNEIEAEVDGKILEVLVENAQPVEYNQPLFLIEPA